MCRFYSCLNDILRYWEIANWVVVGERIECDSNPRFGAIGNGVLRIADFWLSLIHISEPTRPY